MSLDRIVVMVNGVRYDVTEFAPTHRGGAEILLRYAASGDDCGPIFNRIHGRKAKELVLTLPRAGLASAPALLKEDGSTGNP